MNPLIDIGANLTHECFHSNATAFATMQSRAEAAKVQACIVTGASVAGSEAALRLSHEHPDWLRATAGIHPHEARHADADALARISRLAEDPKVCAIGETGLDFNRDFSPRDAQLASFEQHIELAASRQKPMFLHERDAHEAFFSLMREHRDRLVNGVVHCFTGDKQALYRYLDLDLHIGITGWICDERRGFHLHELVKDIPAERLMIETDAPYLLPRTIKPKPKSRHNEPAYLPYVLDMLAQQRRQPVEQLAESCYQTSVKFFNLDFPWLANGAHA